MNLKIQIEEFRSNFFSSFRKNSNSLNYSLFSYKKLTDTHIQKPLIPSLNNLTAANLK